MPATTNDPSSFDRTESVVFVVGGVGCMIWRCFAICGSFEASRSFSFFMSASRISLASAGWIALG